MVRERNRYSVFLEKTPNDSTESSASDRRTDLKYHFGIDFGTTNSATAKLLEERE